MCAPAALPSAGEHDGGVRAPTFENNSRKFRQIP